MTLLEGLKFLSQHATPGPWEINYTDVGDEEYIEVPGGITAKNGFRVVSEEGGLCDVQQAWTTEEFESNAELIALSRNNIDALIAVVEAAKRVLDGGQDDVVALIEALAALGVEQDG